MKVRSTGLGKTELTAHVSEFSGNLENAQQLIMKIEATEPVHWYITAFLTGKDLRQILLMVLKKPGVIFKAIWLLLRGK
jgi:hypothetical protein